MLRHIMQKTTAVLLQNSCVVIAEEEENAEWNSRPMGALYYRCMEIKNAHVFKAP